ncbi:ATP-binding protein [Sphaerisporangium perillae]|uniref:ATP-binding protein n=1 Tax=Sphaerisporangium perillae TaxID=2935860 RepID=UPI00200F5F51|nr:ATP-binding protein [Sphaerisporangium perillae]
MIRVRPRRWDPAERTAAQQLDQMEPAWAVWYGVGARCFYAVAIWPVPESLVVQARSVGELRDLMREAELRDLMREAEQPGRSTPRPPRLPLSQSPLRTPYPPRGATMPYSALDGARTVCWDLPCDLSVIGKTRSMVREVLTSWALQPFADDVILVVDELLANALTYGEPPVRLTLSAEGAELRVQVTDHAAEQPRHLHLGIEAVHGRGLTIVEALAHECGVTPLSGLSGISGKTVWACWRLSPTAKAHSEDEPVSSPAS